MIPKQILRIITVSYTNLLYVSILGVLLFPFGSFAALATPHISISPYTYYPAEEVFYIEGKSDPHTSIIVMLQQAGTEPLRFTTESDQDGTWVLSRRISLTEGYWEMRARVERGVEYSPWTEQRIIRVVATGITVGNGSIPFSAISLVLLTLFIGGGVFFVYAFLKAKSVRHNELMRKQNEKIRTLELRLQGKEVEEALKTVRAGFSEMKEHPPSIEKMNQIEDTIEEELRDIKDNMHKAQ